jgi:hypothetical protein
MSIGNFPTWPVDGPPPLPPVHGLIPAANAPAAGIRIVVDTTLGPADENDIAPDDAGLEPGLFRGPDGSIQMRAPDGSVSTVFVPPLAGQERWMNGIEVWPYPPDVPEGWDACAVGSDQGTKSFGTTITPPSFAALTISEPITCTSQQVPDQDAFKARAVAVLSATESFAVARELMSGETLLGQPFLADGNATILNGGTATRPNHALQLLEESIALTGRLGVIHCTPMLATALLGQGFVIKDVTGVIRTINGIVVVPDFGYVGVSQPEGSPAPGSTEEYAYATGPVDMRRSAVFTTPDDVSQALDRGTPNAASNGRPNTITYRAERYYVTDWDTALQVTVLVDRCGTDCVVGS